LGCNLAKFKSTKGIVLPEKERLFALLVSIAWHVICKLHVNRVVKNPGSTLDEKIVHNQWVKAINTALSRGRLLTNKIGFGTLAFKTQQCFHHTTRTDPARRALRPLHRALTSRSAVPSPSLPRSRSPRTCTRQANTRARIRPRTRIPPRPMWRPCELDAAGVTCGCGRRNGTSTGDQGREHEERREIIRVVRI
jgi:hypothetical protein